MRIYKAYFELCLQVWFIWELLSHLCNSVLKFLWSSVLLSLIRLYWVRHFKCVKCLWAKNTSLKCWPWVPLNSTNGPNCQTYFDMNPPLSHFLRASVFSGKSSSGRWRTSTSTESSACTRGLSLSSSADTMSCRAEGHTQRERERETAVYHNTS